MKAIVYGVAALSVVIALPTYASVMRDDSSSTATSAIVETLADGTLLSEAKAVYHRLSQPVVTSPAPVNRVPEPATLALLGVGLAGIRLLRRRDK